MKKFAKLFECEKYGQVVMMLRSAESDNDEVETEIAFHFRVDGQFDGCSSLGFKTEESAEAAFEIIDHDKAMKHVGDIVDRFIEQ